MVLLAMASSVATILFTRRATSAGLLGLRFIIAKAKKVIPNNMGSKLINLFPIYFFILYFSLSYFPIKI